MNTYHIHITGIVQGVGFRPYVYKVAKMYGLNGTVCNANDGVHIEISCSEEMLNVFLLEMYSSPDNSRIDILDSEEIAPKEFTDFKIIDSDVSSAPNLLLTPDIALCNTCKNDIDDIHNRRFQYAFTTCLSCGPRYSINKSLPYDRCNTTMQHLKMCEKCEQEYHNVVDRRFYSQTNSCKNCPINLHIFYSKSEEVVMNDEEEVSFIAQKIVEGKICAIKGVGGYLLICDATNEVAIKALRNRKQRPGKPFAVLYSTIQMALQDVQLRDMEIESLQNSVAPIVLCQLKKQSGNGICTSLLAPHLGKLGIMLPYSPLLYILSSIVNKPMVATSGNVSGSPILYRDEDALEYLFEIADYIVTYDREIVVPQDDSVLQFSALGQKIILRRGRGMSPTFYPHPFIPRYQNIFATGADMKAAFALTYKGHLLISQYLGNQATYESQLSYRQTLQHLLSITDTKIEKILTDKHPGYFVSQIAKELSAKFSLPISYLIQHHKAHFAAVLFENYLERSAAPVLGVIWDGTGYGDDGQIWGGEFFVYKNKKIKRVAHFKYFPQLHGDKMSLEPRLSALSLLKNIPSKRKLIQKYFTQEEWQYFQKLVVKGKLQTSSAGRFLDGIACIMGITAFNTYEGEAAMRLEEIARNCLTKTKSFYRVKLINKAIDLSPIVVGVIKDINQGKDVSMIAWKVFFSLFRSIVLVANKLGIQQLSFSGGVFQNALLVDIIKTYSAKKNILYFHKRLSPNDEGIAYGQMAYYRLIKRQMSININMRLVE